MDGVIRPIILIIGADGFGALSTQPFSVMTGFDRARKEDLG